MSDGGVQDQFRQQQAHKHKQKHKEQRRRQRRRQAPPAADESAEARAEREEAEHYADVTSSFSDYERFALNDVARRERHASNMPAAFASRLPPGCMAQTHSRLRAAVEANQAFLNGVLRASEAGSFGPEHERARPDGRDGRQRPASARNYSKVLSTLHQCSREWAAEAAQERGQAFEPIKTELRRLLPVTAANVDSQRVLVPGCGLGRLPIELVGLGYAAQGNEFSYHMLLMSAFLLNHCSHADEFTVHPWIDQPCNVVSAEHMLRCIRIPDVDPRAFLEPLDFGGGGGGSGANVARSPNLSMCAGEFLEVYKDDVGCWDAVVTCFFLDTAPNVIEYIEAIERLLRPGGVWINFGPLMYHWYSATPDCSDERYERAVEFTLEEVRHIVRSFGFTFAREEMHQCGYTMNRESMMRTVYNCAFFSAVKQGGDGNDSSCMGGGGGSGSGGVSAPPVAPPAQ